MQYSLFGFFQPELIKTDLDLTDLVLMKYISIANSRISMTHIFDDNKNPYVWLSHSKIHEDLPFIKMSERNLKYRLTNLKKNGWIESITKRYKSGSATFYTTTKKYENLIYTSESLENTAREMDCPCTGEMDCPSDNKLIDNKLKTDISNDISADNSAKNISKGISSSNSKVRGRKKLVENIQSDTENEKPKKKDKFTKMANIVNEYTDDEKLKLLLFEYIKMRLRLEREGKQRFIDNYFKLSLKDLDTAVDMNEKYITVERCIKNENTGLIPKRRKSVEEQSMIRRGIQMTEPDATSLKDGKEAKEFTEELIREAERRGRRAVF